MFFLVHIFIYFAENYSNGTANLRERFTIAVWSEQAYDKIFNGK